MKKHFFGLYVAMTMFALQAQAQQPELTEKETLSTELKGAHSFSAGDGEKEILEISMEKFPASFTLEVKGKVSSATGRGLDVDLRKKDFNGFRTSWNAEKFRWAAPLASAYMLNFSSAEEQTFRYAVDGSQVHIYQNGVFIETKPLTAIYDIDADGVENTNPDLSDQSSGENLTANVWGNLTTQTPFDAGWRNNGTGTVPWEAPNGYGVRFTNNYTGATYNGAAYSGSWLLMLRWESGVTDGSSYYYPVDLKANTSYNFSFLRSYWNNGSSGTFSVGVSKETTGDNLIAEYTTTESISTKQVLRDGNLSFTTTDAGTYYILIKNDGAGIWVVGGMVLKEFGVSPRLIVGKNYLEGAEIMEISSLTYDASGAYAPIAGESTKMAVSIQDEDYSVAYFTNADITVYGESDVHITDSNPLRNSTINLTSEVSWLFLERIQPSDFLNSENGYLSSVKINGSSFDSSKDRVAIYGSGCVVIPNGKKNMQEAITIYSGENFSGESQSYAINAYNNSLGDFDNNVKSFKLKRGFSAALANNNDGTGFSKYFIASDEDLEVATMPDGLVFVSFIRAFKWEWTSKKGTANLTSANPTIIYNWSAGGDTNSTNTEFVPIRQNGGWPSFTEINALQNVSHVLGFNEPARSDQANISVNDAIGQWPQMFKSGLRIGSPAPASISSTWLQQFIGICDSLNYRVDFIAFHAYQDQAESWWDWNVELAARGSGGSSSYRPVWITEWNNGANWTNEADASKWPDYSADLLLTTANAERQRKKMEEMLKYFETNDLVEHQFLYNWVNDARALELNGALTPAGKMFAAFNSGVGYKKVKEYDHQWRIAPGLVYQALASDYVNVELSWYDHNGETGKKYIVERKGNTETSFTQVGELILGEDYQVGSTVRFSTPISFSTTQYRIKAFSYKDTESIYSREVIVVRDDKAGKPTLSGKAISSNIAQLNWTTSTGAKAYNVKRATIADGTYELIAELYSGTSYEDKGLESEKTYYYKVVGVNSAGEGTESSVFELTMPVPSAPSAVTGLYVSAGDERNVLTWDFAYDAKYNVLRSDAVDGEYVLIEEKFDGTRYVDHQSVENGVTYYYKVQATNELGDGKISEPLRSTPKNGQYAHFDFDEGAKTTVYDKWGGFHGSLLSGAGRVNGIANGGAVTIYSSSNSYVELGEGLTDELEEFTIATWFKNGHTSGSNARLFDFGSGTGAYMCVIPYSTEGQVFFVLNPAEGSNYENKIDYQIPSGMWLHFAITFTSSSYKLYINGELIGEDNANTAGITPKDIGHTTQNWLGKSQWVDAWADYTYDDFRIYNYALDAENIAELASQEDIDPTVGTRLLALTINGEEWDVNNNYSFGCDDSNMNTVTIEITPDNRAYVVNEEGAVLENNQLVVSELYDAGRYTVQFRIVNADDPSKFADYVIDMTKYLAFDDVVGQRWGNVLAVNNNSETNGGYNFTSFSWYKDGKLVSNKQYYTAGQDGTKLDTNASFQVGLRTDDGTEIKTCESVVELMASKVDVYPTQVVRGQQMQVETTMLDDAVIKVYNLNGVLVNSKNAHGNSTTISAPNMGGIYLIQVNDGEYVEQVKIVVK